MRLETMYEISNTYGAVGYISSKEEADNIVRILKRSGTRNLTIGKTTRAIFESKEDFLKYISEEEESEK